MSNRDINAKHVTRTEMQGEKNWWTQGSNLGLVAVLTLLTLLAIFVATRLLGPADEAADALRSADAPALASEGCGLTGEEALTGALPQPSSTVGNNSPQWAQPFPMLIDPACDYHAIIVTNRGPIEIDLLEDESPLTVNNFVALAESGFYNGLTFHRVIPGFVAQAGDPLGTGAGGPGYQFADEFTTPSLRHDRPGMLSMANAGPNTNGSQFFITYAPTPHLDPFDASGQLKPCGTPGNSCHAIFGVVTSGLENAAAMTPIEPGQPGPPDVIEQIVIEAH